MNRRIIVASYCSDQVQSTLEGFHKIEAVGRKRSLVHVDHNRQMQQLLVL